MKNRFFQKPIFWAFFVSFIYWIYLVSTSHMIIEYDAANYENLGKILAGNEWRNFFLHGPNREPIYPLLISFSIRIGAIFSVPYQLIQVFLQFLILFITQILMLRILRILNINNWISAFTILYLGISPAIVNSALSLFSEIAIYPLVLAVILIMNRAWVSFSGSKGQIVIFATANGLIFVLLTLCKGILEVITPIFVILFFLSTLLTRNRRFILNAFIYLVIVFGIFYSLIGGYKLINKKFNGNFVVTCRSAHMIYGSAARRAERLTRERFLCALAYVPGDRVCEAIFGKEKCFFWSTHKFDDFGGRKTEELRISGLSPGEVESQTIRAALKKILGNPAQFVLLWFIEGLKMFFWESTQGGFVSYPANLTKLFCWLPFKNGLRLLMFVLTFASLLYLISYLFRERKNLFVPDEKIKILLFLSVLFIFLFGSAYALCLIVFRYIFPIVPLFLIIIAYFFQRIYQKS